MSDSVSKKPGPGVVSRAAVGAGTVSGDPLAPAVPVVMIKCPKCGGNARDIARFCPRCHATLRYKCPACAHEQRHGGTCDACQIDFVKYITAVVTQKQAEADLIHDRIERRSGLLKNLLLVPLTGGYTLLRYLFVSRDRK